MVGAVNPDSFDTLHSYSNTFQVPSLTPYFPEKVSTAMFLWPLKLMEMAIEIRIAYNPPQMVSSFMDFATSMRPDFHRAVIDTIAHYGWKHIIYLYHTHEGMPAILIWLWASCDDSNNVLEYQASAYTLKRCYFRLLYDRFSVYTNGTFTRVFHRFRSLDIYQIIASLQLAWNLLPIWTPSTTPTSNDPVVQRGVAAARLISV